MPECVKCGNQVAEDNRFCPSCGAAVLPDGPTVTSAPKDREPIVARGSRTSSASVHGRFEPGTKLGSRYRIVGLLGRGGMGEVYRADDLELGQSVALKFLPERVAADPTALDRFRGEVRNARKIAHPNVCRMYDIGEIDGHVFLSMEYIDGEDMAHVLARMGRPSQEKALEIARQLCLALAAAHENGVLHRDLKPANIMIDGRGRVRITDFGLAGLADELAGRRERAGTPAYMAPEQLEDGKVSVRSDIYSLGLVLSEMFTGRRVFDTNNVAELKKLHSSDSVSTPTSSTNEIDPAMERVIERCLERDPQQRPQSVYVVLGALPGSDPLAAALAAGETPSPDLVASAGAVGGLKPAVALPCFLAVVLGLIGTAMLNDSIRPYRKVSMPQPPAALVFRADEVFKNLGYDNPPTDQAYGFDYDKAYIGHIKKEDKSPQRWDQLASNRPPAIYFWYRRSPAPLVPPPTFSQVTQQQPPPTQPGMAGGKLDPNGRLVELAILPNRRAEETNNASDPTDWASLFAEAQLNMASFKSVEPEWNPPVYCHHRAAWEGHYPERPGIPIRIEAGSYGNRANFFKIIGPWGPTSDDSQAFNPKVPWAGYGFVFLIVGVLVASIAFAKNNWKLRRGDRQGAFRASLFYLTFGLLSWLFGSLHVTHPWQQLFRQNVGISQVLYFACFLWLLYMGFEPYVRRRWPRTLISWTRLLMGRLRDPLVGRDILLGALAGVGLSLLSRLAFIVPTWFEAPPGLEETFDLSTLARSSSLASAVVRPWFLFIAFWHLFVLFALRVVLRRQWLTILVYVCALTPLFATSATRQEISTIPWMHFVLHALWLAVAALTVLRFGLLSWTVAMLVTIRAADLPITADFSTWYANGSLMIMIMLVAVAAYGCHTALAGRSIFKDDLEEGAGT